MVLSKEFGIASLVARVPQATYLLGFATGVSSGVPSSFSVAYWVSADPPDTNLRGLWEEVDLHRLPLPALPLPNPLRTGQEHHDFDRVPLPSWLLRFAYLQCML